MHETAARLYQAAAELRRIHHLSELATTLAVSPQTVRNWEKNGLSKKGLQEAQQIFGISLDWLQTGKGNMLNEPSALLAPPTVVARATPHVDNTHTPALPDVHAFALQKLGVQGEHIRHEIVKNDNMLNTLEVGDTVLIDTNIHEYIGSGIYALATELGVKIYRINLFQNGFLVLINDNPAYPPEMLRPDELGSLKIVGRVVGKYGVVAL